MILELLKKNTKELHDEAEKYNDAYKILNHTITKDEYKELLITNYYSYKPIENFLWKYKSDLPEALIDFADFSKSEKLALDLEGLDVYVSDLEIPSFGENEYYSVSKLYGMLYVIEGSMMGGMLIAKQLEKCTELDFIAKHHFFNRDIDAIMNRWKTFRSGLENLDLSMHEMLETTKGANLTFDFFKQVHLQQHPV